MIEKPLTLETLTASLGMEVRLGTLRWATPERAAGEHPVLAPLVIPRLALIEALECIGLSDAPDWLPFWLGTVDAAERNGTHPVGMVLTGRPTIADADGRFRIR